MNVLRRPVLHASAKVLPRLTARQLARRYLSSVVSLSIDKMTSREGVSFHPLGQRAGILRFAPTAPAQSGPRRILLVHGHDGHVRQFLRLIRQLRADGIAVDALILPGHLTPERTVCGVADIVGAIADAHREHGPYDGAIGHCISANAILFALGDGLLTCPRLAFVSMSVDMPFIVRQGGEFYGLTDPCARHFVESVSDLCVPYPLTKPWEPIARTRTEPLLVVHARRDTAAPVENAEALAAIWPGARLMVSDTGDHNGILNVTPAITAIADFMREEAP